MVAVGRTPKHVSTAAGCGGNAAIDASDLACVESIHARDLVLTDLGSFVGNLNADGAVQFDDFLKLASYFGKQEASYSEGNIDLVNGVDFADFLYLSANFGNTNEQVTAVPEPVTSPAMIVFLGVAFIRWKNGRFERFANR